MCACSCGVNLSVMPVCPRATRLACMPIRVRQPGSRLPHSALRRSCNVSLYRAQFLAGGLSVRRSACLCVAAVTDFIPIRRRSHIEAPRAEAGLLQYLNTAQRVTRVECLCVLVRLRRYVTRDRVGVHGISSSIPFHGSHGVGCARATFTGSGQNRSGAPCPCNPTESRRVPSLPLLPQLLSPPPPSRPLLPSCWCVRRNESRNSD